MMGDVSVGMNEEVIYTNKRTAAREPIDLAKSRREHMNHKRRKNPPLLTDTEFVPKVRTGHALNLSVSVLAIILSLTFMCAWM